MIVERKHVPQRPGTLFQTQNNVNNQNNNVIDTHSMIYERGEMTNIRENHSQFSNPLSGRITPNEASDFSILPIEQGQLKTMRYSELTENQKGYGIGKWARKFQNFLQGIYYVDDGEDSQEIQNLQKAAPQEKEGDTET